MDMPWENLIAELLSYRPCSNPCSSLIMQSQSASLASSYLPDPLPPGDLSSSPKLERASTQDIDEHNFLLEGPSSFSFSSFDLGIINKDTRNNPTSIFTDLDTSGQNDDKYAPRACDKTDMKKNCVTKSPSATQDRVMAERVRRERLAQRFIALSALIPGLTKVDKASILGDAIMYLKQLEERTKMLEEQISKKSVNKSQSSEGVFEEGTLQIEAKVSDKDVIIRVHCEKKKGLVVQLLKELEKLNLNVVNTCVLPFGLAINMTVVAKVDADFSMTVKDLVRQLSSVF